MKKLSLILILFFVGLITPAICIVKNIEFRQNCGGYLKQAADANTVEIALERVDKALAYIEKRGMTNGYTSVVYRTEDENVGFWYTNIKACKHELESCLQGTQLEKSNVLIKVRESLTDNGDSGTVLTVPNGISRYPNNTMFAILLFLSAVITGIGCLFLIRDFIL